MVAIFKKRSAELGEPNTLLLFAKLASPTFSLGIRKIIIAIKKILTIDPKMVNTGLTKDINPFFQKF
jgi:hypothetical protein